MATADKLTTVAQNVPKVYHAGQLNVVENAECLKGTKTDTAMLIDDVSPVTHEMGVRVRGKNLIPYPFIYATLERHGITFTDNKDGTITLNGQNNGSAISNYNLFQGVDKLSFLKPNTDYYLSCNLDNIIRSLGTVKSDGTYEYYTYGNINFPPDETPDRLFIQIKTTDTTTYDNTVVKLQIELGTTATDYEPYNSDIQNVHSKNLIPYPYAETTKTVNGVTFTDNGDGTITVNGTTPSDSGASFMLSNIDIPIKAGIYTTSGCVSGSNSLGDNIIIMVLAQDGDYNMYDLADTGSNKTATIVNDSQIINLSIQIPPNITLNNAVFKPQLEYGSTATAYTKYHEPYPLVVSRYGKNLFDYDNATKVSGNNTTFTKQDGKIIVGQSIVGTYKSSNVRLPKSLVGKAITITAQASTSGVNVAQLRVQWAMANGTTTGNRLISNNYTGETDTLLTLSGVVPEQPDSAYSYLVLMFYSNSNGALEEGITYTATYSNIQIELGTTATDYEPYISPTDYTPNTDGTINGVESLYPSTTLLTNDPYGKVYIDCDYYKDIDKAFNELSSAIALSGGE